MSAYKAMKFAARVQMAEYTQGRIPTENERLLSEAVMELAETVADLIDRMQGNGNYSRVLTEDDSHLHAADIEAHR